MINKNNKIINNRFSIFLKFIFFLRYLLLIFFIALVLFLIIPQFFDYRDKEALIKDYLSKSYGLQIENLEIIEYKPLPIPSLQIYNLESNLFKQDINMKTGKLTIYPELFSIYNYDDFVVKKIKLENSAIVSNFANIKTFLNNVFKLEKKLIFKDLNLIINENDQDIIKLKKINFFNHSYKKNIINGEVFNKKFKVKYNESLSEITFKSKSLGFFSKLIIPENNSSTKLTGVLKGKILKSYYKLDFSYAEDKFDIINLFFRDKKISFNSKGNLKLKPYFNARLNTDIKNINMDLIDNIDINEILDLKDIIKKLNFEKNIVFKDKKFSYNLIQYLDIQSNLAYGRLNVSKRFRISESNFFCKNNLNFLEEYPVIFFECSVSSPDIKKLLKNVKIVHKKKDENFYLSVKGYLNILNRKINFDFLEANGYTASIEDLKYFKKSFENILFDESFFNIFNLTKIKNFILEIT